jgi:hypothetical protein
MIDISGHTFSVQQLALLQFVYRGGQVYFVDLMSQMKIEGILIELITTKSNSELFDYFRMSPLDFISPKTWPLLIEDIHKLGTKFKVDPGVLLGTVMEIMDILDWQVSFDIRKFLVLMLSTKKEFTHLKISVLNTEYEDLANFNKISFENAEKIAKSKSKLL